MEQQNSISTNIEAWYATWGFSGKSVSATVLAHIRMLRPTTRLWFDTILPLATIVVLTQGNPPVLQTVLFIIAMNLIHIAATIVNDIQDAESDKRSSELLRSSRPIANGIISRKMAVTESVIATAAALVIAYIISWQLAVLGIVLCGMLLMHELPPVRTQSRPILSQVASLLGLIVLLFSMIIATGYVGIQQAMPYLIFAAAYMALAEMLVKDIRDVDNDAATGKETTAVKYGAAGATRMAAVAYLIAGVAWVWFLFTFPGFRRLPMYIATGCYAGWIGFTIIAANRLDQAFSKTICRILHRGSVVIFTVLNLSVIWSALT